MDDRLVAMKMMCRIDVCVRVVRFLVSYVLLFLFRSCVSLCCCLIVVCFFDLVSCLTCILRWMYQGLLSVAMFVFSPVCLHYITSAITVAFVFSFLQ